jgi:hypothetical protein
VAKSRDIDAVLDRSAIDEPTQMSVAALPDVRVSGLARAGTTIIIGGIVFLQRLGIPAGGEGFIHLSLLTSLIGMAILSLAGALALSRWRTELWAVTVVALVISTFCQWHYWSPLSLGFLVAAYTPLVLVVEAADEEVYKTHLEPFQWFMIAVALLGVYQFATMDSSDPFDRFGSWVITGFNTHGALSYGSNVLRSNGYVLLEPSFFSQYCAIAIVMELTFFRKLWRIPLYAAGIFVAAGGTGLVILLIFVVAYAWHSNKLPQLAILAAIGLIVLWMFSDNVIVQNMLGRTSEVTEPGSSAYLRFVAPFLQLERQLVDLSSWIVGLGPGASSGERLRVEGWDPDEIGNLLAPIKMLIEYGLIGAVPFMIFVTKAFFDHSRSVVLSLAMFICYTFMSASLQHPPTVYLSYVICMMFPDTRRI